MGGVVPGGWGMLGHLSGRGEGGVVKKRGGALFKRIALLSCARNCAFVCVCVCVDGPNLS